MSSHTEDDRKSLEMAGNAERDASHATFLPTNHTGVPPVQTVHNPLPPSYSVSTQAGVLKAESAQRVWGRNSKIAFFVGVALASYIYSLDGTTTWQYQAKATSSFSQHSLLGAIATAQAIVLAVTKPFSAKVSDVFGRAEAYSVCVFFYCLGYIIVASCKNVQTFAAGAVIYEVGYAGLQILIQIVIADCTTMRWRGLVSSLPSIWFFVNAFVSSNIAAGILDSSNWHWGYAMFIILIPVVLAPIIVTLFWAQYRAKKLGLDATDLIEANGGTAAKAKDTRPWGQRLLSYAVEIDAMGLLLFGAGWACILLPITLTNKNATVQTNSLTWQSGKIIALLTVGAVLLVCLVGWEMFMAKKPLFPGRFFKSWTVLGAALIGFFDFVSFYLQYTYQYSFIAVTRGWSTVDQGYFAYTQTLTLTLAAILAGFWQLYFRRTKWILFGGLLVRLLGIGLMIKSRGAHGSTAFLVWTQILQGLGGGVASASCQLLAQVSVPHQDLATVTAFVLLFAEIGNAVGTAIAASIWRQHMPDQLTQHLSGILNSTEIAGVYGSIYTAATYQTTNPAAYEGIITAYSYVMKILLIAGTAVAVIPPLIALGMKNIYLSDAHNAVEAEALDGRPLTQGEKESA
ncbi:hypothetical protein JCM8097_002761 [Rhodosporidiobolus ruineniae]